MQIQNFGIYIYISIAIYIVLGFYQDIPSLTNPQKPMNNAAFRVITATNEGCELLLMAFRILGGSSQLG